MKSELLICLAFVFGIGFGLVLAKPSAIDAAMKTGPQMRVVRVARLHLTLGNGAIPVTGPVVGFTCSPNTDGSTDCYIASQP
jgi:hypothetical protein